MTRFRSLLASVVCLCTLFATADVSAQKKPFIPRRQSKVPGPPLSPADCIKKMTVPAGFTVELVAAEPNVVNPVAMCFDEKGRAWITESLEYPRRSPGKGRDRVKILEDTNGDGTFDKSTVFMDGLNIPSGIAVGYGGVWVANSPDILFVQDTDGDGKADKTEVVVTGFGRTDTHELPNSLVWGPDGWLYGLNGVFNYSNVKYGKTNPNYDPKHPGWKFTCAMFRIHPRTREFQVFAEGTSNPWGIAWNNDGEAFLSACVIDHLWHITETGYYHRQGGPYPPHTWKIESIVKHKHQLAAYCGIHYYDSDAYPKEYRGHLYMGNIHGNCINVDTLRRDGSTYFGTPRPDFLSVDDVWFMPVAQKTGPDGCLYILDWYDRYHCYQDANADPKGIDRLHGRLYRIRYKNTPRAKKFDLSIETDDQLIQRLHGGNGLLRRLARRLLTERNNKITRPKLQKVVLDDKASRTTRLEALWTLIGTGSLEEDFHLQVMKHKDPTFRAWGVRAAGNFGTTSKRIREQVVQASGDKSPIVRREVVIAVPKLKGIDITSTVTKALENSGSDKLLQHIVWNNLQPVFEAKSSVILKSLMQAHFNKKFDATEMLPLVIDRMLSKKELTANDFKVLLMNFAAGADERSERLAANALSKITNRILSGELRGKNLEALNEAMGPADPNSKITVEEIKGDILHQMMFLGAAVKDTEATRVVGIIASQSTRSDAHRLAAARVLLAVGDQTILKTTEAILTDPKANSAKFRAQLLSELGRAKDDKVAEVVLKNYAKLEPELQPRAVELLTQRVNWSKQLLAAIGKKTVPATAINLNQARRLMGFKDKALHELVRKNWGVVRTTRDPKRAEYVAQWKSFIQKNHGDPFRGEKVFKKVCAQCHKLYGEGADVGPDITRNGRNNFDQLLSNVFDPSLVIGASYRAFTVATKEGRVITGLVVENSPQRIVLKVQGGKQETIARDDIELAKESKVSMMPEQLEKQLKPQEIADLFAFITLDKHPKDPNARQLPGVQTDRPKRRGKR